MKDEYMLSTEELKDLEKELNKKLGKDGSNVNIGENDDDLVFTITDLLPHLGKKQGEKSKYYGPWTQDQKEERIKPNHSPFRENGRSGG